MAVVTCPKGGGGPFRKNAFQVLRYVIDKAEELGAVLYSEGVPDGFASAAECFKNVQEQHGGVKKNQVFHIMQSFHEKEYHSQTPEQFARMGADLAEKLFPGHLYVVGTHLDTKKVHNHIAINVVNSYSGERIQNRLSHLSRARDISDNLCKQKGLSVLDKTDNKHLAPWERSLVKKLDIAREISTSFNEYAYALDHMGVKVKVEDRHIKYYFGNRQRARRGAKLGEDYDKNGLIEAFKSNDKRYHGKESPRDQYFSEVEGQINRRGARVGQSKDSSIPFKVYEVSTDKDYTSYLSSPRRQDRYTAPSLKELGNTFFPFAELSKASRGGILSYCGRHGIEITNNHHGQSVLKGREYVVLSDRNWINTRNDTYGNLIDFVSIHQEKSAVAAVAEITGNKKLLEMEPHMARRQTPFKSFHIPKSELAERHQAKSSVSELMKANGGDSKASDAILKSGLVQVHRNGNIRLLSENGGHAAIDYEKDKSGHWNQKHRGDMSQTFFSALGKSNRALVYTDPMTFFCRNPQPHLEQKKYQHGVLVLMSPDSDASLSQFFAANRGLKSIELVSSAGSNESHPNNRIRNKLQLMAHRFGIEIVPIRRGERRESAGVSFDLGR